jgi:hypothetical protein
MPFVEPSYFYYQMQTGLPPFPYFNPYNMGNFGAMPLMTPRPIQDDQQSIQSLHFDTDNRSEKKINQNRPQSVSANTFKNEPRLYNNSLNNRNGTGLLIEDINKINFEDSNLSMNPSNKLVNDTQSYPNIISKRDENRLTPLLHPLPHVKACFSINSIVKIRPNDPCEGQPALVDILNISDIIENYFLNIKTLNIKNIDEKNRFTTENDNFDESIIEARNEILFSYNILKEFPGPLVKENTSKAQVIQFCQKKIKDCLSNPNMNIIDPHSHALLWDYLALLVRQNGIIDLKNDVSPLLLSGIATEAKPVKIITENNLAEKKNLKLSGENITISSTSQLQEFVLVNNDNINIPNELIDDSVIISEKSYHLAQKQTETQEEILMDKLRHFLGAGQVTDAIEYAIKFNLWSHALFLASTLNIHQSGLNSVSNIQSTSGVYSNFSLTNDSKLLNRIKLRFINSLPPLDPLQTCYQLLIGRVPTIATVNKHILKI